MGFAISASPSTAASTGLHDALLDDHRVCAGSHVLQAFADDGLRHQGCRCGAVAGHIVGLGGNFLHQLCTHVFKGIFQLDLLGDGNTVVGDQGRTKFLIQHHIAPLGPQGNFDGICQLVYASFQGAAGFLTKYLTVLP